MFFAIFPPTSVAPVPKKLESLRNAHGFEYLESSYIPKISAPTIGDNAPDPATKEVAIKAAPPDTTEKFTKKYHQ